MMKVAHGNRKDERREASGQAGHLLWVVQMTHP
jgi:hypothetical protein